MQADPVNKVAASGLITIDLQDFAPAGEICSFDLRGYLYMDQVLREKDYREALKRTDWETYRGKRVAICCTTDAVIPAWAFMLAAVYLKPVAASIAFADAAEMRTAIMLQGIRELDPERYRDERVVIKGCGDDPVPLAAYVEITSRILPVVKSLMYGEPCSTVPLFKSK